MPPAPETRPRGSCAVSGRSAGQQDLSQGERRQSSCEGLSAARVWCQYLGESWSICVAGQCGARRRISSRYVCGLMPCRWHEAMRERKVVYQSSPCD